MSQNLLTSYYNPLYKVYEYLMKVDNIIREFFIKPWNYNEVSNNTNITWDIITNDPDWFYDVVYNIDLQ